MAATFFAFLCFALFAATLSKAEETPKRHRLDVPFALALALSFYSKNFYTWLIVLPPVLAFLVTNGCTGGWASSSGCWRCSSSCW